MPSCASGMQPDCLSGEAGSSPVGGANGRRRVEVTPPVASRFGAQRRGVRVLRLPQVRPRPWWPNGFQIRGTRFDSWRPCGGVAQGQCSRFASGRCQFESGLLHHGGIVHSGEHDVRNVKSRERSPVPPPWACSLKGKHLDGIEESGVRFPSGPPLLGWSWWS